MDGQQGFGIKASIIHGRGHRTRSRIKILDLLRDHAIGLDIKGQLDRILEAGAGMA